MQRDAVIASFMVVVAGHSSNGNDFKNQHVIFAYVNIFQPKVGISLGGKSFFDHEMNLGAKFEGWNI